MTANKYQHWRLDTDAEGITWCHLDVQDSSANILSTAVLDEFQSLLAELENNLPAGVVFTSDKAGGFIAGADVSEFSNIRDSGQALAVIEQAHGLFDRLERLDCPVVALINGYCLGGGMELALACHYRVALDEPAVRLGLPEVRLGIHPGFGGTVRSIEKTGAVPAMQMMLAGKTVDVHRAARLGLIDYAVPRRQLQRAAVALIRERPPRQRSGWLRRAVNTPLIRPALAWYMHRQLQKRVDREQYPAPYALLDLWRDHGSDRRRMLSEEARSVAELITTETARNLVRVYLLQEQLKSAARDQDFAPRHIHVVGAGAMGGDIAAWCALQGFTVSLQDRAPEYIAPAISRAHKLFRKRLKARHLRMAAMDRLFPDHKGYGAAKADVVIEAISEDLEAKQDLFKSLEDTTRPEALLATNTSSIPLDAISADLAQPERLVGMHFFNPVAQMQLVEIVHSEKTGAAWIGRAMACCRQLDRLPLPVKSSPGFLVNRILTPYLLEAVALLEEGVQAEVIDQVMRRFGMPMGPVELADAVGLDICLSVAGNMAEALDITVPEKLRQQVAAGNLGKKSGQGFYYYKNGRIVRHKTRPPAIDREEIEDRLVLRTLNECAACLREQLVADADAVDAGMIYGTGFAPFRGGPMHYARHLSGETIRTRLEKLEQQYGSRFHPDTTWREQLK